MHFVIEMAFLGSKILFKIMFLTLKKFIDLQVYLRTGYTKPITGYLTGLTVQLITRKGLEHLFIYFIYGLLLFRMSLYLIRQWNLMFPGNLLGCPDLILLTMYDEFHTRAA